MKLVAFSGMALVWGLTWIAARWAVDAAPPVFVAGMRLGFASLVFFAWCVWRAVPLAPPSIPRLLAASLLVNTGCYSFLFWGVAHAPTGLAAIVNLSLIPILSMLIGAAYGEEQVTRRRLLSVALGAAGLALLFGTRNTASTNPGEQTALGLGAVLIGTCRMPGERSSRSRWSGPCRPRPWRPGKRRSAACRSWSSPLSWKMSGRRRSWPSSAARRSPGWPS